MSLNPLADYATKMKTETTKRHAAEAVLRSLTIKGILLCTTGLVSNVPFKA